LANLEAADLEGADLTGADLLHARLNEANLRGANLISAPRNLRLPLLTEMRNVKPPPPQKKACVSDATEKLHANSRDPLGLVLKDPAHFSRLVVGRSPGESQELSLSH
jgi:uncharacterized protein YjbI with pentapeptide repeats